MSDNILVAKSKQPKKYTTNKTSFQFDRPKVIEEMDVYTIELPQFKHQIEVLMKEESKALYKRWDKKPVLGVTSKYDNILAVYLFDYSVETISHESMHCVQFMLENLRYNPKDEVCEIQAHLVGWLTQEIYNIAKQHKPTIKKENKIKKTKKTKKRKEKLKPKKIIVEENV